MKKSLKIYILILIMTFMFSNFTVYAENAKKNIPVLMYHHISNTIKGAWSITPQKLEEQLAYLKSNGYKAISLDMLYSYIENKIPFPEKSVVITFDDGYNDAYYNAFPLLKKYDFKAVFFIITGEVLEKNVEGNDYMLLGELKELDKAGMDLEAHTVTHPHLEDLDYNKQFNELDQSKQYLEKHFNKRVYDMAYPYGLYNKETLKAIKDIGYRIAFTIDGSHDNTDNNRFNIGRIYVNQGMTLKEFGNELASY